MLKVTGLTKKYGNAFAIRDVSFSAEAGEIVGLVGHNGCGKSTTMNIITGYITPTAGTVEIDGVDCLKNMRLAQSKIGYLPETPPLYPDLTVEEQLTFAAGLKRIKDPKGAIISACEKADVLGARGRLIANLSKGYRQRVGLAQAFLGDPPIVILDEPSNGLDPRQIAEIRGIIRKESRKRTILISSHILQEMELLCDRLVILSRGTVCASGTLQELIHRYSIPGAYKLSLGGVTDREALRRIVENAGCQVTCLEEEAPSLESVFLKLTGDTGDQKEARP